MDRSDRAAARMKASLGATGTVKQGDAAREEPGQDRYDDVAVLYVLAHGRECVRTTEKIYPRLHKTGLLIGSAPHNCHIVVTIHLHPTHPLTKTDSPLIPTD